MNEINIDIGNKVTKFDSFLAGDEDKVPLGERGDSKDRLALLKQGLSATGVVSDGDVKVQLAAQADRQEKELEEALVDGEDQSTSGLAVDQAEEPVLEIDGDDDNKDIDAKPQDTLDLGRFGYTKEQVDGWIAQGYSVSDIKNGVAASGEKNTEVPNQIAEPA